MRAKNGGTFQWPTINFTILKNEDFSVDFFFHPLKNISFSSLTKHSHSWHCESHFWPLWYSCSLASSPDWSNNWHLRGSTSFPADKHWGQQFRASLLSVNIEQLEQERAWHEATPFKHWHSEQPSRHWDPSRCSTPSTRQSEKKSSVSCAF